LGEHVENLTLCGTRLRVEHAFRRERQGLQDRRPRGSSSRKYKGYAFVDLIALIDMDRALTEQLRVSRSSLAGPNTQKWHTMMKSIPVRIKPVAFETDCGPLKFYARPARWLSPSLPFRSGYRISCRLCC
jgi:hypothetical protein